MRVSNFNKNLCVIVIIVIVKFLNLQLLAGMSIDSILC